MILEDETLLRPLYLPFSVANPAAARLRTHSPADGGSLTQRTHPAAPLYPRRRTSLEEVEHAMVELAMRQANNNQTHAAKLLDISRDALRYKLKKFGLIRGDEEGAQLLSPRMIGQSAGFSTLPLMRSFVLRLKSGCANVCRGLAKTL